MTPRNRHRIWLAVWDLLSYPPQVTVLMVTIYVTAAGFGLHALTQPETSGHRGVMAWLLVHGCALGAVAAPFGWWALERIGLIALGGAIAMRFAVIMGYMSGDRSLAVAMLILAAGLVATRWVRIRILPHDPRPTLTPRQLWRAITGRGLV